MNQDILKRQKRFVMGAFIVFGVILIVFLLLIGIFLNYVYLKAG